jgi:hypothetical protein
MGARYLHLEDASIHKVVADVYHLCHVTCPIHAW